MSASLTIRAGVEGDIAAMAALLTQLNRDEGYDAVTDPVELSHALFGKTRAVKLRALVAHHPKLGDAAADDVVGVLLYYTGYDTLSGSVGYHLADIVVAQDIRRQGWGKALFAALAQQCLHEKGEWISLTVLRKNAAARNFYQSLGLTHVAVDFFAIGKQAMRSFIPVG